MRFILSFGLSILLSSCATTTTNYYKQTVQSWRGGSVNTLAQHWGKPDRIITAQNGHSFYIYQTQSYHNLSAPAAPSVGVNVSSNGRAMMTTASNFNTTWNRGPMSMTCLAAFEVAQNGVILNTHIQGNSCYGGENFARQMMNPSIKRLA